MKLWTYLKLLALVVGQLFDVIKAIEAALPAGGQGTEKLRLVREFLESIWDTAKDLGVGFEEAWPRIEKWVGSIVGLFNRAGEFKKG